MKKTRRPAPQQSIAKTKDELTQDQIAMRAYELFLARGETHGRDLDDWLNAERELRGRVATAAPPIAIRDQRKERTAPGADRRP